MKRLVISILVAVFVFTGGLWGLNAYLYHQRTTQPVTINLKDVVSAELIDTNHDEPRRLQSVSDDSTVRIPIGSTDYAIRYQAADGFADGIEPIESYQTEVNVVADYSDERLANFYQDEQQAIRSLINNYSDDVFSLYDLRDDRLYVRGQWFGGVLDYKGGAIFNRDNVAIVARKNDDNQWVLVTKPPMPSLNIHQNPDIPISIIESLNDLLLSSSAA